jgi:asparagine synthase (glutamine-hydrolysing)
MLRVSEAVATSAKVLLTGDGGDDVFLGYPRHRQLVLAQSVAGMIPRRLARQWYAWRRYLPAVGPVRRARHFLDYATGGLGAFIHAADGFPGYQRRGMLGERLRDQHIPQRDTPWSPESARRALLEYLEYDLHSQFVSEYLMKVDGATMYFALEARSPFFDQELWEFAASLPLETRLHHLRLKGVLRALAKRRIGARVARGRKRGFMLPVRRWIADRWRPIVESHLQDGVLAVEGWIRPDAVARMLGATPRGAEAPLQLWHLFVLEEWMRHERASEPPLPAAQPMPPAGALWRT